MKSKQIKLHTGGHFGNILDNFTKDQLAWIGAVAMAYNEAENALHHVFAACIQYPAPYEVSSRINGIDGIIQIIRCATPHFKLPQDMLESIEFALGGEGFSQLKVYRDSVLHARLFDMSTGIATVPGKKGSHNFVLLKEEALQGLYMRLFDLKEELEAIAKIIEFTRRLTSGHAKDDPHRARLEESSQAATALCQSHQTHRRSLLPLPQFPEQSDILAARPPKGEARLETPGK
jgi:hypothetical protein